MTREEAMRCLSVHSSTNGSGLCTDEQHYEAKQIAIQALEKELCENAISRQAVLDKKELVELEDGQSFYCISPEDVETLPPVTPQPKTGHWIYSDECHEHGRCSECGYGTVDLVNGEPHNFCRRCGAKMIEPQESEE